MKKLSSILLILVMVFSLTTVCFAVSKPADKGERIDTTEKNDRTDKASKVDRGDAPVKVDRGDAANKVDRGDAANKVDRGDAPVKTSTYSQGESSYDQV